MEFKTETDLFDYIEKHFYAAALCDSLDEIGFPNQVIDPRLGIRPLREEFVTAGRAATLLNAPDPREEKPYELAIAAVDQLKQDSLIVATWTEQMKPGIMGELTATAMRARRSRGAVVDGYTRDARMLLAMSFPTFARGASPIDTAGRTRIVDYNCPVQIGDVRISPGDIVFADFDGIVVIPKEAEAETIEKTIERVDTENRVRKHLAAGGTMAEAWEKYRVL
jgi:regulator of RNase E activity RraA